MTHTCAMHVPGANCYQKCRCRCDECKQAQSRYAKHRRVKLAQGINDLVDAEPVRAHVEHLMNLGMSHGTIALKAGMSTSGLQALLGLKTNAKQLKRMHRRTAKRITSVTYSPDVGRNYTAATETQRYLQDLALRGFSSQELSTLSGIEKYTITITRAGKCRLVRNETATTIRELHKHLEGKHPTLTSKKGQASLKAAARKHRYAPLAAWDDITNPNERPKGTAA